jgi:hypothetical protein
MAVTLLSKAAYARHRGCDEKAVRKAVAEGRITTIDGKIDPAVADIQWAQNTRARAGGRAPAPVPTDSQSSILDSAQADAGEGAGAPAPRAENAGTGGGGGAEPGYHDYRTRRERADAERAERENMKEAGRLIDRDTTERTIFDAFRRLRDDIDGALQPAAAKVAGLSDAREIERVLRDEVRDAVKGWEARMLAKLPVRDATA